MITFLDGPAKEARLSIARAPYFLRVVKAPDEPWDALDQLHDTPKEEEVIYVYRREGPATVMHLSCRDEKGRRYGKWQSSAEYVLHCEQPTDTEARDTKRFHAWCRKQSKKYPDYD